MRINESYDSIVKDIVEKYESYLKKDNYDYVFEDLAGNDMWEEEHKFLDFLYNLGINAVDYITEILPYMFADYEFPVGCRNLVLSNNITEIGEYAFTHTNIETIDMSRLQITEIPYSCFVDSSYLHSVKLPNTLKHVGEHAFMGCTGLTSISIPEGVIELGYGVFIGCSNLTEIELPASLIMISDDNFNSNGRILTIYTPKGSYAAEWVKETYDFAIAHGRIKLVER